MQSSFFEKPVLKHSLRPMGFDQQVSVPGSSVYFHGCFRAFANPSVGNLLCAPVSEEVSSLVSSLPPAVVAPGEPRQLLILQGLRGEESAALLPFAWLCHSGVNPVIRHQVALADFDSFFLQFVGNDLPEIWITTASWENVAGYFPEYQIEELHLRNLKVSLVRSVWPDYLIRSQSDQENGLGSSLQKLELAMIPGRVDPVLAPWINNYYSLDFEPEAMISGGWPGFRPLTAYTSCHPLFWGFPVALGSHWFYTLLEDSFSDPMERLQVMELVESHLGWGGGPDKPGGWCDPRMQSRLTLALAQGIDPVLEAWFAFLVKAGIPAGLNRKAVLGGFLRLFTSHSQPWV